MEEQVLVIIHTLHEYILFGYLTRACATVARFETSCAH